MSGEDSGWGGQETSVRGQDVGVMKDLKEPEFTVAGEKMMIKDGKGCIELSSSTSIADFDFIGAEGGGQLTVSERGKPDATYSVSIYGTSAFRLPLKEGETKNIIVKYTPGLESFAQQKFELSVKRLSSWVLVRNIQIISDQGIQSIQPIATRGDIKYTVSVGEEISRIDLRVYPDNLGARISLGNTLITDRPRRFDSLEGLDWKAISLVPGPNNIRLFVISEDRSKRREIFLRVVRDERSLHLNSAAAMAPRPEKLAKGGEDAFAMYQRGNSDSSAAGIASGSLPNGNEMFSESMRSASVLAISDGVSSWDKYGINSGKYSKSLMKHTVQACKGRDSHSSWQAVDILRDAFKASKKLKGSATALVLSLVNTTLTAAIVGDSKFILLRNGKVFFESPTQEVSYNTPFQLGNPNVNPDMFEFQSPDDARQCTLRGIRPGDVIVMGTDGLFDNVFLDNIETLVALATSKYPQDQLPELLSTALLKLAMGNSAKTMGDTPWARKAEVEMMKEVKALLRESGGDVEVEYDLPSGGKPDDISVIAAVVQ
ncbi:hypothetical protein AAMO2058_000417400 [Amorphochlora amoebiformis]